MQNRGGDPPWMRHRRLRRRRTRERNPSTKPRRSGGYIRAPHSQLRRRLLRALALLQVCFLPSSFMSCHAFLGFRQLPPSNSGCWMRFAMNVPLPSKISKATGACNVESMHFCKKCSETLCCSWGGSYLSNGLCLLF